MKIRLFKGCRDFYRKSRYKKGGYRIRLTRGYTDGEMDSRPD